MKSLLAFAPLCLIAFTVVQAEDDTPIPPEVQSLAEAFVAALKSGDDAALSAGWHTPEVLAKVRAAAVQDAATTAAEPLDPVKERERELKRQAKYQTYTRERAAQLREQFAKHFGDVAQLKLDHVELDVDDDAPAGQVAFDDVEIYMIAADGTKLMVEVDDAIKVDEIWKFKGALGDSFAVFLPEKP